MSRSALYILLHRVGLRLEVTGTNQSFRTWKRLKFELFPDKVEILKLIWGCRIEKKMYNIIIGIYILYVGLAF